MSALRKLVSFFIGFSTINPSLSADDCQPYQWTAKRDVTPGQIVCRYTLTSPSEVNYYTCTELADRYDISIDKFFQLNPDLDRDCEAIKPNTDYCVAGFVDQIPALDGLCGPKHNNATCRGTKKQCCNSETWICGDTADDCREGTCYEGACHGATEYAIDGKCGQQHGDLKCGGKWGSCCDYNGKCGNGTDFCSLGKCQSGDCEQRLPDPTSQFPWLDGNSTDGACGGTNKYVCNPVFGYCCGGDGECGMNKKQCGSGW
ncbi:hypothetical protein BKA58DRAFT_367397 [Alternaria rosae]|uniref:uncharacterized protein n=1 Tax=Alternaria rosae TaxID=1187941 RepID=UPI001E8D5FA4|nr:uncharacterized protein BKA58DRAFT_367397 [Alternaria rosae]KAH6865254.1 hypothetical protein BKA58DRAFT_367397 [Alternaria rosae]